MFKKLKEKITEEVKSSPQRLQQFTQSVSEKLQNTQQSDENFFSIDDNDDTANSGLEPGFTNVSLTSNLPITSQDLTPRARRTSNSSVASDVSFLPHYESSPNMYHLQSDVEASASELEDNLSTSSQLGHLSKEQIYSAFQKAQMRYHKYRGRYTDLSKHYRDLEREVGKMKAVLVETQDKAIRRVNELKEQCSLEQKAKAHLEAALRDELDEKQFKIETLETKISLLQHTPLDGATTTTTAANGSNGDFSCSQPDYDTLTKYLSEARSEIEKLNEKIQEFKANSIIYQSKETEYKQKIAATEREVAQVLDREKTNNLNLAQIKMELHNELVNKDLEITNLKRDMDVLKENLETFETKPQNSMKLDNLQSQNAKLIERLEGLTLKCSGYESDLLRMQQLKSENDGLKHELLEVRDQAKSSVINLESRIHEKLEKEFCERELEVQKGFDRKFDEITANLGDLKQNQIKLLEQEDLIKLLEQEKEKLNDDYRLKSEKFGELERNYVELIEESTQLRYKLECLEKEMAANPKLAELETELVESQSTNVNMERTIATLNEQLRLATEKNEAIELDTKESDLLEIKLQKMEQERRTLLENFEKERIIFENLLSDNSRVRDYEIEVKNLQSVVERLEADLAHAHTHLSEKEDELTDSEKNKLDIIEELKSLTQKCRILEEKCEAVDLEVSESRLLQMKLQKMEEERKSLLESFENERIIFEQLLSDHSKLQGNEDKVIALEEIITNLSDEIATMKDLIETKDTEFCELDKEKLKLEQQIRDLTHKLRVFEERDDTIDLENTESRLLEMKLQELETEKLKILDSFENERVIFDEETKKYLETEKQNGELQNKLAGLEAAMESLHGQLEEARKYQGVAEERENELQESAITTDELRTHNQDLEVEIARAQEAEAKVAEEKRILSDEIEILKHELTALETNQNSRIAMLETLLGNAQSELETKQAEVETKSNEISRLFTIIDSYCQNLQQRLGHHSNQIQNDSITNTFDTRLRNFELAFSSEKDHLVSLLEKLKQFEANLMEKQGLQQKNDDLTREIDELKGKMAAIVAEKSNLEAIVTQKCQGQDEVLERMRDELQLVMKARDDCQTSLAEVERRNTTLINDNNYLTDENQKLESQLAELKIKFEEQSKQLVGNDAMKARFDDLLIETESLRQSLAKLEKDKCQLADLERHLADLTHEKQLLLDEVAELKTQPLNLNNASASASTLQEPVMVAENTKGLQQEIDSLRDKLTKYKSLDITNRSSIEFYEGELEKLRLQNEKLSRKLDETLVTLNHCAELSNSTEIEYLRNVLYNYMIGKESLVLARVIAAVCKFDPQQTETILAKEQQKQSLLGQLGII